MPSPLNCCIFCGRLSTVKIKDDPLGAWRLGTITLLLPEKDTSIGQVIKLKCWNSLVDRLEETPLNSWLKVISSYSLETFKGKSYPVFEISSFTVVRE